MEDKRDKSDRLKYLNGEKDKQEKRKSVYLQQLEEIRKLLEENEKEINYNEGWIKFHENSIVEHKKEVERIVDFEVKKDQEKKLKFHQEQIENHHNKNIGYHKKEVKQLKKR